MGSTIPWREGWLSPSQTATKNRNGFRIFRVPSASLSLSLVLNSVQRVGHCDQHWTSIPASDGMPMWTLPLPLPVLVLGVAIAGLIAAIFLPLSKTTKKPVAFKASSKTPGIYTVAEIAKHNTRDDCWIIIKGKVYDVTAHVEEHPGGDAILNHAGGDSTEGFFGPQHATRVFDMVEEFYIGELDTANHTH